MLSLPIKFAVDNLFSHFSYLNLGILREGRIQYIFFFIIDINFLLIC